MLKKQFDDNYMVYSKLLDGLDTNFSLFNKICLLTSAGREISSLLDRKPSFISNSIKMINNQKFDLIISIYGLSYFKPLYESIQSIFKSMNVGGKFVFILYPTVYDEKGNDILNSLSLIAESTYYDKLKRWKSTFYNGLSNLFIKLNENELTYNATFEEIKFIFGNSSLKSFLFDTQEEFNNFFKPIENNIYKRYSVFWNTVSGIKI